ncbi:bifunctional diguanylate cyclase/phosphodiesterase [Pseudomonas aeruginosa]|uniref:Cyclic di-GMP phosphodiesterase YfgF n=2 Tax=Pseudomonas aeruginosa TaxID=287 RepID=A0A9P1R9Z1_PSEAI|nr:MULTISPECIES: GGDEF domain-containing phosphodiesterase [Pseudomonas]KFF32356.1 hypothetical protein G039_0332635 [Pseudomonas aeruginosa VRFPA01]SCZ06914.1 Cyclic di-GMP phosphodiesterase YfgF [Acinetobacter baumannii]EKV3606871.1 EAL domain-containing protein [Pseudomonas aeruginosa]EKW6796056.1 EAL domain-containing protein [Pseudomonas aeruginosa]EKX7258120.1 EAL domain-containing protein [Pseudomonas aeruginosa]
MGSAIAVEPVDHCQMVMANAPGTRGDLIQFIEASSAGRSWLVLHLDIANFRYFNQMLGWRTADDLLALIGQALVHDGRHRWYRVGGDEWVGICEGRSTEVGVTQVPAIRRAIQKAAAQAVGETLRLDVAVGIAVHKDLARALVGAESASRNAKRNGRPEVRVGIEAGDAQSSPVLRALLAGRQLHDLLELHHQRIEHFEGGAHYELLARCAGRSLGPVIPTIEEMGLAHVFDMEVVRHAVALIPPAAPEHAINLSAASISSNEVVLDVISSLRGRNNLSIEITETAVMEDPARAQVAIEMLRAAGHSVYLDDFGEGATTMSMLEMPFSAIKLGTSLASLACPPDVQASVVQLIHSRGMLVVGEGVETEEQRIRLAHVGADAAQGYLLHRPAPTGF